METDTASKEQLAKPLSTGGAPRVLFITLGIALILGSITGYILSGKQSSSPVAALPGVAPKTAQQDNRTFRDFSEGVVKLKPTPKDSSVYTEGTHILERDGQTPVALTSSVIDLSIYEGKKVKVYGETQKALKEGWLMDVGKVEELQ